MAKQTTRVYGSDEVYGCNGARSSSRSDKENHPTRPCKKRLRRALKRRRRRIATENAE